MPKSSEHALTKQVIESFSQTTDPRLKELITELVRSLHGYVQKTKLTFEEWNVAIDFLTRVGQKCTPLRQEFILLSDVLGVSMMVDTVNHDEREGATETTVLGPFYVGEHKPVANGADISAGAPGSPMFADVRVLDLQDRPVPNVAIDVWHADGEGFYDTQQPSYGTAPAYLRARFATDTDGRFSFRTVLPSSYPIPTDGPVGELIGASNRDPTRPAHVHFLANAPGFEPLITHVFIEGDGYIGADPVFGVKEELVCKAERHEKAIMLDGSRAPGPWYTMKYDFRVRPGSGHVPQPLSGVLE